MADVDAKRQEERIKLFATALSNVGVATIVTGFISPLFSGGFHFSGAVGALILGMMLHFVAQTGLHYVVETPPSLDGALPLDRETEP